MHFPQSKAAPRVLEGQTASLRSEAAAVAGNDRSRDLTLSRPTVCSPRLLSAIGRLVFWPALLARMVECRQSVGPSLPPHLPCAGRLQTVLLVSISPGKPARVFFDWSAAMPAQRILRASLRQR